MRTVKNKTPIVDFLKEYAETDTARLHMPGHKGKAPDCLPEGLREAYRYDITEITGADNLYDPHGIIKESEENASEIFGVNTYYLTEGSSQAVKAMIYLALTDFTSKCKEKPYIITIGSCHKAFYQATGLLNVAVEKAEDSNGKFDEETISSVKSIISSGNITPVGIYVTYPDYFGNVYDLKKIKEVIKNISEDNGFKQEIPLLVDGAHSAYFRFLDEEQYPEYTHPAAYADMCCTSAHKTLPTLTGSAYLHIKDSYSNNDLQVKNAMGIFGSTSPSYLIMASLDAFNAYADKYKDDLKNFCTKVDDVKKKISEMGFNICKSDPLRITVLSDERYSGRDLTNALRAHECEAECFDDEYVILMLTPYNTDEDLNRIKEAFSDLKNGICSENDFGSSSSYNCLKNFS